MRVMAKRITHYTDNIRIEHYGVEHGCFANARDYVCENGGALEDSGLLYCEGLCYDPVAGVAFHHAWAVDPKTKCNYEVSPLEADIDGLEYWGWTFPDAWSDNSNATIEAVLGHDDLVPLMKKVWERHPDTMLLGTTDMEGV